MKKCFLIFSFLLCINLFTACSATVSFIVVNDTDEEITLEYSLNEQGLPPNKSIFGPLVAKVSGKLSWDADDWSPMDKNLYVYSDGKFTLKVSPKEAVKILTDDDYRVREGVKKFAVNDLKIRGDGKEVYFQNSKRLFEEFNLNDFKIIYR
jgi:hypothetical protein